MVKKSILRDKNQTGKAMYEICYRYFDDLDSIYIKSPGHNLRRSSDLDLGEFYDFCRMIPYKIDKKPIEVIGRPLRIVKLGKIDCKKKAVLMGSYAAGKKIPFRFIASSSRPNREIHHVFPELSICGEWVSYDATYPGYYVGMDKRVTRREVL